MPDRWHAIIRRISYYCHLSFVIMQMRKCDKCKYGRNCLNGRYCIRHSVYVEYYKSGEEPCAGILNARQ